MRESAGDAVVAVVERSGGAARQVADVLVCSVPDEAAAHTAVCRLFADYPGCVVVAAVDRPGGWCLLATRPGARPWRGAVLAAAGAWFAELSR